LTEGAEDVLSQLGLALAQATTQHAATPEQIPATSSWPPMRTDQLIADDAGLELVVERLGPTPVAVDELVRQCHLSAAAVATLLLELELAGRVERHPGNLVSLR
jgi:DNA processing protein